MTRLFKFVFRLVFGTALLVLALVLLRNVIAEVVLERQLRAATGMEVSIGRVRIGLTEPTLALLDLRVFNTDDFGRTTCLDVPELYVEYDLEALRNRQVHLKKVRLDLAELHIVQNDQGRNNFRELLVRPEVKSSLVGGGNLEFRGIDTLNLALGRFRYTDLNRPSENDELFIGLKGQVVRNVKSLEDVRPLLTRLALERNGKQFYDKCFSRGSNSPPVDPRLEGKAAPTNSASLLQPAARNP